jgi:hypothetical protein
VSRVRIQDQPNKIIVEGDGELVKVVGQGPQGPKGDPRTAAATVTDETTFGLSPVVGSSVAFAREDHTHGSQPREVPDPSTLATDDLLTVSAGVYVGTDEITVDQLNFDTAATQTLANAGEMAWDVDRETVALRLDSQLSTYLNQDSLYHVVNQTGVTISKGTVVGAVGTLGVSGKILIAPFLADGSLDSQRVMGVTSEDIGNGAEGFVQHFGLIRMINTSAYSDGDLLYASSSVAGGFQTTAPTAPANNVLVALVIAAANNGVIFVRPTFGSSLANDELVNLSGLADNDLLQYDSATGVFVPVAPTPGLVGAYPDTNPSSFVDAAGAAAAAPVQSVNGGTGVVVLDASDVGAYADTNPSNFIDAAGAPVQSVNGDTGVVTLGAADVGAVPTSRTISTSGTGLSGGGDLTADRTITLDPSALAGDAAFTGAFAPLLLTETTTRTANYTLALTDQGKVVPMDGTDLDLTVPTDAAVAFPVGSVVNVYNLNSTDVTIAGDSGVTVRNDGDLEQYAEVSLRKRDTDEWVVAGNLS